jgi:aryl sulfotransferase
VKEAQERKRYRSLVHDSARWEKHQFREGDIVVSAPAKCGTTWAQMLSLLLVLDTTELPRPLSELSPWLDATPLDLPTVLATLESQQHRRVIKTHTPLDGLPFDERASYVCIGRDPRDAGLSNDNALANITPEAMIDLYEAAGIDLATVEPPPADRLERFWGWVTSDVANGPAVMPLSLANLLGHLQTFWHRRDEPQVVLLHYRDLLADLPGQLRDLANALAIEMSDDRIEQLATAATFDHMKQRADQLAPEASRGIWRNNSRFFARGVNGQWHDLQLDATDLQRYQSRVAELASPDLAEWVHTGWLGLADQAG